MNREEVEEIQRAMQRNEKRGVEIVDMLALEGFSYAEGNHILSVAKCEITKRIEAEEKHSRREISKGQSKDAWTDERIKKTNWPLIIFVSMITALITTLVCTV